MLILNSCAKSVVAVFRMIYLHHKPFCLVAEHCGSVIDWFCIESGIQQVQMPLTAVTSVIDGLKRLYVEKLKPLEVAYRFNDFASPSLVNNSISLVLFEVLLILF